MLNILLSLLALALPLKAKVPSDVSVYKNNVYVVDGLDNRLIVLNKNTLKVCQDIDIKGNAFGIYVDDSGIYLTYPKDKMLVIYNLDGEEQKTFHFKDEPVDIVKKDNKLWISFKKGYVGIYDLNGNLKKKVEGFSYPGFLAKDNNFVYVVDNDLGKVILLNSNGNIYYELTNFGIVKGKVFRPTGIAVDDNYVYVGDPVFGKVEVLSKAGHYEGYYKNIDNVLGVAVDNQNIYALDSLDSKLIIRKKNEVEK